MELFTEQAYSRKEALRKIYDKYGERAKVLNQRTVRLGGFMGLFAKEGVEITGYLSQNPSIKKIPDMEEEKQKILNSLRGDKTMEQLLKEVQYIKQRIEEGSSGGEDRHDHENMRKIENLLSQNEFTVTFIRGIKERLKKELSYEELDDFELVQNRTLEWIAELVNIHPEEEIPFPRTFILVGPTGVGKTTTIAKLAAMYGVVGARKKPAKVRILTIDNYRIGAKKQIETYGEIMGIPVSSVESPEDAKKYRALYQDVDIIFVDTIGKSPHDAVKLAEMQELLRSMGSNVEVHLALSATTKTTDVYEILHQFEPFKYRSIIITKLDETGRIGNLISVLSEYGKPISYITDGQRVPQDIAAASKMRLIMNLEGFMVNRESLEKQFG